MSRFNYVATALKPTAVNHSCFGKFTGPVDRNLIIAKFTRLEVYLLDHEDCFQKILDVPVYGSIDHMQLFCPDNEEQDLLFILTRRQKYFVLQWDPVGRQATTRWTGDFSVLVDNLPSSPSSSDDLQICTVNEDGTFIALHAYDGLLRLIPGQPDFTGDILSLRPEQTELLDMKFLYSCGGGTLIVLYEDKNDTRNLQTFYVAAVDNTPASTGKSLDFDAFFLIPVLPPLNGVLVVGTTRIDYFSVFGNESNASCSCHVSALKDTSLRRAYATVDDDRFVYLIGDDSGQLFLLSIAHEKERVTGLELKLLGETSEASTISYLGNQLVYIGAIYGDSMLIRWNREADSEGSYLKVLDRYLNLGVGRNFCMVDSERDDQGQIVSYSKGFQDGSTRSVRKGTEINEVGSVVLPGYISGIWSLRSTTDDRYDTYLVVSILETTGIWKMNPDDNKLEVQTEIGGLGYDVDTLFCHNALDSHLIQVTSRSVRLVNLRYGMLTYEWPAPADCSITVATATDTQVLLATNIPGQLVYLEIECGVLVERKQIQLENDISCLDISPVGENPNFSNIAAVGLWNMGVGVGVLILSLPDLAVRAQESISCEVLLRSLLLCVLEGRHYLLCGSLEGLVTFSLDMTNSSLSARKDLLLGGREAKKLCKFSVKDTSHVFAASDRPVVIFSSNGELLYSDVYLKTASHVCPFSIPSSPDSLAIVVDDKMTVYLVGDVHKCFVQSIFLEEPPLRICRQKKSRTFAVYGSNSSESFIRLFDQTFNILSTIALDQEEMIYVILDCSLSDDKSYYCIGTGYANEMRGRILVLNAEDQILPLVAEIQVLAPVYNLTAIDGKLLRGYGGFVSLYSLVVNDEGICQLRLEFEEWMSRGATFDYIQTRGNIVAAVSGDRSIVQLLYKPVENTLEVQADHDRDNDMAALVILNDDLYLGADEVGNIFTVFKKSEGTDEERESLEVVGEYHLGEWVKCFCHGSLAKGLSDSAVGDIVFGTMEGSIGVIVSLPEEKYNILEKLQDYLRNLNRGLGGLSHREWRVNAGQKKFDNSRNFVDGDLIESFIDLDNNRMDEISGILNVSVEGLKEMVQELKSLH